MDDGFELKARFEAMKAKANQEREAKRQQQEKAMKLVKMKFDIQKGNALTDYALKELETSLRPLKDQNNRPAEKLVKGRIKSRNRRFGPGM